MKNKIIKSYRTYRENLSEVIGWVCAVRPTSQRESGGILSRATTG